MWLGSNPVCPVKFFLPPKEQDPVLNLDSHMSLLERYGRCVEYDRQ